MKQHSEFTAPTWILKSPEGIPVGEYLTYHGAIKAGYEQFGLKAFRVEQNPPTVATIATPFF
jgi:hypothetical protein